MHIESRGRAGPLLSKMKKLKTTSFEALSKLMIHMWLQASLKEEDVLSVASLFDTVYSSHSLFSHG